ncbi:NAD(P)/FAD-dependent oxidoreductase [Virgibacillus oceani]|uniref:Oxidoreductase n=1 Tax=Virgibacillus oceani TaxID=1479511 RepID=A0A917HSH6_9BACI|nr:FAD-binding oxidoreductase [Virgibacillus oceani]GGG87952.1 oxidoreductase [Virgibacillus oceani]
MQKYIVIGAGILGATTAYQLAKSGAEVVIIDRNEKGQATDAAAGMICPWLSQRRNKAWYKLAKGGARIYPEIMEGLRNDGEKETGYAKVGAISLHTDEKKLIAMKERAIERRKNAPEIGEITLLDPQETKALFPPLAEGYSSVHVSGAARVDGRALRNALLNAAAKHGATIMNGNASLLHTGRHVTGITVSGKTIEADTVIAASGAWMNDLLKPLHIQFNVWPQKGQIMHVQLTDTEVNNWPVVMPPNNLNLLAFNDNRIIIGATHDDNMGFDNRVTAAGIHEILSKALQVAPGLAESMILETRVGFRPFTPGFLPVIGPLPGFNNLILANGLGASGLTMGPYIGSELAKLALGKEMEIDINDYDVAGAVE